MNKVILLGRLTRDPEVRFTQSAEPMAVCRFTVAVDRPVRRDSTERNADFINCVCFGRRGENIGQFFHKGNRIAVSGRIQTGEYTDQSGNRRFTTDVVVEDFDFCESKNSSSTGSYSAPQSAPSPAPAQPEGFYSVDSDTDDEDLPF